MVGGHGKCGGNGKKGGRIEQMGIEVIDGARGQWLSGSTTPGLDIGKECSYVAARLLQLLKEPIFLQ